MSNALPTAAYKSPTLTSNPLAVPLLDTYIRPYIAAAPPMLGPPISIAKQVEARLTPLLGQSVEFVIPGLGTAYGVLAPTQRAQFTQLLMDPAGRMYGLTNTGRPLYLDTIKPESIRPVTKSADSSLMLHLGGEPVESLNCLNAPALGALNSDEPRLLGMDIIPGKGMNVFQLRASLPGLGPVNIFASPDVGAFAHHINAGADPWGNSLFSTGGAVLLPYANRVRGRYLPESNAIETTVAGRTVHLPANWEDARSNGEKLSMHGLTFNRPFEVIEREIGADHVAITGKLAASDFGGLWPSKTDVTVRMEIRDNKFTFKVTAKNVGNEPTPMGIGWHPYFAIPSGQREQARLVISANKRALFDEAMHATGRIENVTGTPYDFRPPEGRALGNLSLDDSFIELSPNAYVELQDPAANYVLRLRAQSSSEIKAVQVFSPPTKPNLPGQSKEVPFVAIEHQSNLADPYSPAWQQARLTDTGMKILQPGETETYVIEGEISKLRLGPK